MELVIASVISALVGGFVGSRYREARMNGATRWQSLKAVIQGGGGSGPPEENK